MGLLKPRKFYQPIWEKGKEYGNFQRSCAERYGPIRELASKFKRPFSVLDVGANYGYFDFRLMEEFEVTCVMVDDKHVKPVIDANGVGDRAVWLKRHLSAVELEALSRSEHFDVVLGLAVLHHFEDWERAFRALNALGQYVFFEIPGPKDIGAANHHRHEGIRGLFDGRVPIANFPSHVSDSKRPLYLIENKPFIEEQSLDAPDRGAPGYATYEIEADFERSQITIDRQKRRIEKRGFIPGMNVHNFRLLGGGYPSEEFLIGEMEKYPNHRDWNPWNFILGFGVKPIDLIQ